MAKIEIKALTKLYYSIGEVAKLLEVNASLLRFWEKEFDLSVAKKNNKGNRLYAVKEIIEINTIYELVKVQGYTIEGAKKVIKENKSSKQKATDPSIRIGDAEIILKLERIKKILLGFKR